ncbi:DUF6585 family protein [Cryptosporangium minutisporangium]
MSTGTAEPKLPSQVAELAAQQGLGELIDQRSNGNPFKGAVMALAGGLLSTVLSCGVLALAAQTVKFLRVIAILLFAVGIVSVAWSVVMLFRGFQAIYVYQGGVVYTRNGKARAARWSDVSEVEVQVIREGNLFAGNISNYVVKPVGQAPMRVSAIDIALPDGERDPIGALLIRLANETGRPVSQRLVGKK